MSHTIPDTSVYVDFSALNDWRNQMDRINSSALDTLANFENTLEELKNSWCGNSATGFMNSSKGLMNKAKGYHNEMKNVEQFLLNVIKTMDNQ